MTNAPKIGIVAIQGDYEAHAKVLDRLGVRYTFVRRPEDLAGLSGVILPGGESTTHLKVMQEEGLFDALKTICHERRRIFRHLRRSNPSRHTKFTAPPQDSLALLDISVLRNGYGRQLASDVHSAPTKLRKSRSKWFSSARPSSNPSARMSKSSPKTPAIPSSCAKAASWPSTFHPELTNDTTVHEYFLKLVRNGARLIGCPSPNAATRKCSSSA